MRTVLKIFIFAIIPTSIFIIITILTTNLFNNETEICLTRSCNRAASAILDYMDPYVDPCDDFYKFVCGKFLKKDLPEKASSINWYTINYQKILEEVKIVAEEPIIQEEESSETLCIKKFYKACMNTTAIEKNSLRTMQNILEKLGGWPVVENTNWNLDWMQIVYKFRKMGLSVNYFIEFSVKYSYKSNIKLINLNQPSLGLEKEYLLRGFSDKIVHAYYEYMVNVAVLLGNDRKLSAKVLKESLIFEIELANITISTADRRSLDDYYQSMRVDELKKKIPSIPWLGYLNTITAPIAEITNKKVLGIHVPQYFADFEALMNRTSKKVAANYAIWRAVDASVPYLSESFQEARFNFLKVLTGQHQREERWKECIEEMVKAGLQEPVINAYLKRYKSTNYDQLTLKIQYRIAKTFLNALNRTSWMDTKTKEKAIIKSRKLVVKLEKYKETTVPSAYNGLKLDENNYLKSFLKLRRLDFTNQLWVIIYGKFFYGKYSGRYETLKCADSFFYKLENRVEIGAGLIQAPFFEVNRPQYLNFAGLGFLMAHEMAHAFDDEARHYDERGKAVDWWTPETEEMYSEKTRCLTEQYGNYTVPDLNLQVNGVNTMRENLADNRGMDIAYKAYKAWVGRYGVEKRLPGMKYTHLQMFWIFATHLLCGKSKPEFLTWTVLVDEHSPSHFRAIGALRNSKYFAEDFGCPLGSRMNPEKKCDIW